MMADKKPGENKVDKSNRGPNKTAADGSKTNRTDQSKKESGQGVPARRIAVETLVSIEKDGAYSTIALNVAFKRKQLSERDRAFVTALVQGVVRHRLELDEKIGSRSKQSLDKMPSTLKNILRIALFQLEQMQDIPASAVVNTSADLARALGHPGHARFVNGLLRTYLREKPEMESSVQFDAEVSAAPADPSSLSVRYSMPQWLVDRWISTYGQEETIKLLQFAQTRPELAVRVMESAITTDGLEEILRANNIECHRGKLVNTCIILDSTRHLSPEKLPGFSQGWFTVQDEAAAFVSLVVDPKPGDLIVDLCAAPGGKSLHLAELMENTGRVVAVDKHASRLNLLKQNRNRLGLTNIEIFAEDGRQFKLAGAAADRVLLDAPCTGTGVINRRSDLRFRREPLDIVALTELQHELLANAATLVKPGGILVYSTCSIEPEENFDNIRWFLREFPEFEGDDLSSYVPASLKAELESCWTGPACKTESEMTVPYMLQLMPSRHEVSGFFVARLRKQVNAPNIAP
jgi:16S rRNA (cytosine967-C5)-methyltransferase